MKKNKFFMVIPCLIWAAALLNSCQKPQGEQLSSAQQPVGLDVNSLTFNPLPSAPGDTIPGYHLIWSDEFNTSGAFDPTKWAYAPRMSSDKPSWNKYTVSNSNYANQSGGTLNLKMDNAVIAQDTAPFKSGALQTLGKFSFTYGKIEVRAKYSTQSGSWPAIWMIQNSRTWPDSGEVDIMEHANNEATFASTLWKGYHTYPPYVTHGTPTSFSSSYNAGQYNVYSAEWTPTTIKFLVNNVPMGTYTKPAGATYIEWPYDKAFFIILDVAGGWHSPASATTSAPYTMNVDYVRVYQLGGTNPTPPITNAGFETGTLSPWTTTVPSGTTCSVTTTNTHSGTRAVMLQGSTNSDVVVQQTITGLQPNTTYTFGGYVKVSATGEHGYISVKNYGGSQLSTNMGQTTYTNGSVTFTTGATNTSATVFLHKPFAGTVYADDFYLTQ